MWAASRRGRTNRMRAQLQDSPNLFLAIANADLETKKNFVSAVKQLNVDEDITVLLDDAIDQIDNSAAWDTEYPATLITPAMRSDRRSRSQLCTNDLRRLGSLLVICCNRTRF